jgi:hypothetical protein
MSLEVLSWIPMGGYAIYGKVGQVLSGGYKIKLTDDAAAELGESKIKEYEYEGRYAALGIGIAASPGLGFFTEIRTTIGGKLKQVVDPVDPLGLSLVGQPSAKGSLKSLNLFVGLEMGI